MTIRTDRLRLLADYLLKLPKDYEHFNMEVFCQDDIDNISTECGTSACALGHAIFAGLPDFDFDEYYSGGRSVASVEWDVISYDYFGVDECSNEWDWMFCPYWKNVDNTHTGAANRIIRLCDLVDAGKHTGELTEEYLKLVWEDD